MGEGGRGGGKGRDMFPLGDVSTTIVVKLCVDVGKHVCRSSEKHELDATAALVCDAAVAVACTAVQWLENWHIQPLGLLELPVSDRQVCFVNAGIMMQQRKQTSYDMCNNTTRHSSEER